jgi:hypothetical protein
MEAQWNIQCHKFVEKESRIDGANIPEGRNNNARGYNGQSK